MGIEITDYFKGFCNHKQNIICKTGIRGCQTIILSMYRIIKTSIMLFAVLTLCLFTGGCRAEAPPIEEDKIFRVGVLGPFSGRAQSTGEEIMGAVEIAFSEKDFKIGDYEVHLIWIDSQSDPERASLAYERAIAQEKIDVCILNWHSAVAVAAMDVAARNKIPHFFGLGGTDVINEKIAYDPKYYSYWMAKGWPSPHKMTGGYVDVIENAIARGRWNPRNKEAAIYGEDTDWGRSFGTAIAADLEAAGWEIVGSEYFPTGATELVHLVRRLRDLDPALIAGTVATAPSFTAFINEVHTAGLESLIIAEGFCWNAHWYEETEQASNYLLDQCLAWDEAGAESLLDEFQLRYGFIPSPSIAGITYDYTLFFIKIAENTLAEHGELNSETIHNFALNNLRSGKIYFNDGIIMEEYRYSPGSFPDPVYGEEFFYFPVVQIFDGETYVVWPEALKEKPLVLPE